MEKSALTMVGGLALAAVVAAGAFAMTGVAGADGSDTTAVLRDSRGAVKGTVRFVNRHGSTEVRVRLEGLDSAVARDAFHGFHIHANSDAANGEGCVADAAAASSSWFTAVDGHWRTDGQNHAGHRGDMPSLYVTRAGGAEARFVTDRLDLGELRGRAVIVHAGPDNFANIPLGPAANQYTANGPEAVTATQNTGNAGDRVLCGVVGRR